MTQEQKQFITKVLQTGIPALAKEHIEALEEVTRIADTQREELNGQEAFVFLDQERYNTTIKVIQASVPFMAQEYLEAYNTTVHICQIKFRENRKAREEKEAAEAEKEKVVEMPADKKKKSA